jgi:hypothetical protein
MRPALSLRPMGAKKKMAAFRPSPVPTGPYEGSKSGFRSQYCDSLL